jgi:RNA polymerase sigma factor (sigma-70 family)
MTQRQKTQDLNLKIYNLCTMMAKGYYNVRMYEDLLQEGLLACYEAMEGYNPNNYSNDEQYFWFAAKRGMSDYYQRRSKLVVPPKGYRDTSPDTPSLSSMRGSQLAYVDADDCHGDDELYVGDTQRTDYEDDNSHQWMILKFFSSLTLRERQVINYRYFSDPIRVMSFKDVGDKLEPPLSATTVSNIEGKIMGRFRATTV